MMKPNGSNDAITIKNEILILILLIIIIITPVNTLYNQHDMFYWIS
jgi:hypothetical protein